VGFRSALELAHMLRAALTEREEGAQEPQALAAAAPRRARL
jgi:hypothetical protein